MKNSADNIIEEVVAKEVVAKEVAVTSKFVKVNYKSTPNKQVAVIGSPLTSFEVIDTSANDLVIGQSSTNKQGEGLALCDYVNPYVTVRLKK